MSLNDQPLISVIIPCFNLSAVIGKCIESVLAQTYKNIEIIVVNDGSTDGSPQKIAAYAAKDKRIAAINRQNGGVGAAYNTGLSIAKGSYIHIIDGDNYLDEDFLAVMLDSMKQYDCDVAMCDYYLDRYAAGRYKRIGYLRYKPDFMPNKSELARKAFDLYTALILQSPCNKLYRAEIIKNLRFDEDRAYTLVVDSDFNVRLLDKLNSAATLGKPLVHYVQYDPAFRKQITLNWQYRYDRNAVHCEVRMKTLFQNYYRNTGGVFSDKLNIRLNNYFVGRFLKIAQILALDPLLSQEAKLREFRRFKTVFQSVLKDGEATHPPYKILSYLIQKERLKLLKLIYFSLGLCADYFPQLIKMTKAR